MRVKAGGTTATGRVRRTNEDAVLVGTRVFAVADGMGGHAAGDVASATAVAVLRHLDEGEQTTADAVVATVRAAHDRVREQGRLDRRRAGLGTTAAGLVLVEGGGTAQWAVFNVGDSRVYRLTDGQLDQVSVDHSEVRELIDAGELTEAEAEHYPRRSIVTRCLGSVREPTVDLWVLPVVPGQRFLICSDGLTGELGSDGIRDVLVATEDPQTAADLLVRAAVDAGGRDNVSAIVVAVASAPGEPHDVDTLPRPRRESDEVGGEGRA